MTGQSLGSRLKQARREMAARLGRDVKQSEVATAVRVSPVTISRYESDLKEPTLAMIERLARFLGTAPGWLAFGEPSTQPSSNGQPAGLPPMQDAFAEFGLDPSPHAKAEQERDERASKKRGA